MKTILSKPSGQTVTREARDYLMIALGMILYGIGWTLFLLPNDITTGGVPGIASIVYFATGFPVQYTYFAINAILLVVSLKVLGFKFSLKTIFGVLTLTFFLSLIQKVTAGVTLLHDQPFMACVLGASFCGVALVLPFLLTEVPEEPILSLPLSINTGTSHWEELCSFVTSSLSHPATLS